MKYIFFQHQFLDNLLNKQGFYKSPAQKDEAIHFASLSRFQELYGDDAEYRPGEPLPRRAFQITQNVTDKLQPFMREAFVSHDDLARSGKFKLPAGWVHPTALHYIATLPPAILARIQGVRAEITGNLEVADEKDISDYLFPLGDVKVMDDDKVGRRRRSKKVPPTQAYPIAQVVSDGYRPIPLPNGMLHARYLGLPTRPLYAEKFNTTTQQNEYDDTKSIDTGWPEIDHNDVLMKAAEILGVPLQDAQLMNFARYKAAQGA